MKKTIAALLLAGTMFVGGGATSAIPAQAAEINPGASAALTVNVGTVPVIAYDRGRWERERYERERRERIRRERERIRREHERRERLRRERERREWERRHHHHH